MKIIKKSNICSYKANDELLANEKIDGLHFTTRSGFTFDSKAIDKHTKTRKPIIYRTENDEMSSIDYTMFCLTNFTRKFPNLIVSLSDTEMTLYIQEMLKNEGIGIKTATPITETTDGDFVLYSKEALRTLSGKSEKTNISKMLELLRQKKKLILDYEAYKDMEGIETLDEIRRKTNDSDDIIISTWTPKRILK
ncbi:MAG: hypothetical protein ACI32H_01290 [Bacilli bacterium]